jgi:predicted CxxxxCH...CXXCH cytochrome family protein
MDRHLLVGLRLTTTWAALSAGCADIREDQTRTICYDFAGQIRPLLIQECGQCHTGNAAQAGFQVDQYAELVAVSASGAPRTVAGDPGSVLLQKAAGASGHVQAARSTQDTLARWVVACRLSYFATDLVHAEGWINPRDPSFHGNYLREHGWDIESCATCHGNDADPAGGGSRKSCVACHPDGASACATCHGNEVSPAPPRALDGSLDPAARGVGAHRLHLLGGPVLHWQIACGNCHVVPTDWRDAGHIFDANGVADSDGRAEVIFDKLAGISLAGFEFWRTGEPVYEPASGTCRNVYCHAGALPAGVNPIWTATTTGMRGCATCHLMPPGGNTHAADTTGTQCRSCHSAVVDGALHVIQPALHIDGRLSLDDMARTCSGCHGSAANAAPPQSLSGGTSTSDPAIGAHQSHVTAKLFSGPIDCGACHVKPQGATFEQAVGAPGHIDSDLRAEVFPGGTAFAGLGAGSGAAPTFDFGTGTCNGVYCHGGGTPLKSDTTGTVVRTLTWTDVGHDTVHCGGCHGLPPTTGVGHLPSTTLTDCVLCHDLVIDAVGALKFDAEGRTLHLNGRVDYNQ